MADLTPNGIARQLITLSRDLDETVERFRDVELAAAEAKRDAELAYARAYLSSEGPVEERKQRAIEQSADNRFVADVADREVAACKEAIKALHARIEVGRTLASNVRAEVSLAKSGVTP
jgi:hypothetical protein